MDEKNAIRKIKNGRTLSNEMNEKNIARIGGEAELVSLNGKSFFIATAPIRGFEKMVEGKPPLFVVQAVMRICGICHAAHAIAACEAFEHVFGIYPPRNGLIAREAVGLLNRIQSHLLHNVMILPDILEEEYKREALHLTISMLERVNKMLTELAGAPTHPNKIVIGGMAREIDEKILGRNKEELNKIREIYRDLKKLEEDENKWSKLALNAKDIEVNSKYLSSHPFYGDRYAIKLDAIKVVSYDEIHEEDIAKKSSSRVALYNGQPVEVGPRARLKIYKNFSYNGIIGLQVARLEEIEMALDRIEEIFDQIEINQPFKTEGFMMGKGEGIGVYEAPRGLLIHRAKLNDEGRIESYSIIVPTMFNIPIMEKTGNEFGIRLYDPCIPCTTHCMEVKK